MIVKRLREYDSFYEVRDGDKWWTVSHPEHPSPLIMSDKMRSIKPTSPLGKRIIKSVNAWILVKTTLNI
jgi:hypothetical protein